VNTSDVESGWLVAAVEARENVCRGQWLTEAREYLRRGRRLTEVREYVRGVQWLTAKSG
jgi:hypothetical protein